MNQDQYKSLVVKLDAPGEIEILVDGKPHKFPITVVMSVTMGEILAAANKADLAGKFKFE
jgi:hypothetical protein